jgi:mevalonate kinase
VRASAPGKVLLLGEHAVVYGHPALAAALDLRVMVEVEEHPTLARLDLPGGFPVPSTVLDAVGKLARAAGHRGGFVIKVRSDLPLGGGLGSSAALGVALARAFKPGVGPDEAAELAMHLERVLHGAPSGVDPAICARGGVIEFVKGTPNRIEIVGGSAWLCVAPTGVARGTHTQVLPLAQRRAEDPTIDPKLARLGELSRLGKSHFERAEFEPLGALFDEAHSILRELGVSCVELDEMVAKLKAGGALGAKLTGAGGGGAAIGLARDREHATDLAQRTAGFAVQIGAT